MKRTETICENRLFRRLYRSAKSEVTPLFVLYFRKNGLEKNRLGITTSTKIGNAVQRNRSRRVLREAYRLLEPSIATGYDFILVARTRTATVNMNTVKDMLQAVLERQGAMNR
ncbi:MAG: ribonuclease P protein component [Clostridia bacterium]|nr:ribonuclease P protein component [Clostridia bacterium]